MICFKTEIPKEICNIDDELKAIYHSENSICIWIFNNKSQRNKFMENTNGMLKTEREDYYIKNY
ncbi:MAG: hypothetical protein O3C01_02420 [Bacteroidetes bacterium]|nr:hypothetical protein [Bacteroidota bacterium]